LSEVLGEIAAEDKETIVFFDELNLALENYNSDHHDTDATSEALWTSLDKQERNRKFFFIGAMNRVDKMPPQIDDRILVCCVELLPPKDAATRKRIFLGKLLNDGVVLSEDAEVYIDENMTKLQGHTGRNLKAFALATRFQAMTEDADDPMVITPAHLQEAVKIIQNTKRLVKYGQEVETDEDRRHREALAQQDQHFVQQQMIAGATISKQKTKYNYTHDRLNSTITTSSSDVLSAGDIGILTDDQRKVFCATNGRLAASLQREIEKRASATEASAGKKENADCILM